MTSVDSVKRFKKYCLKLEDLNFPDIEVEVNNNIYYISINEATYESQDGEQDISLINTDTDEEKRFEDFSEADQAKIIRGLRLGIEELKTDIL
jgi:hypothetical protein